MSAYDAVLSWARRHPGVVLREAWPEETTERCGPKECRIIDTLRREPCPVNGSRHRRLYTGPSWDAIATQMGLDPRTFGDE